jgi:glycosyltransferase 2 family protein
LATTPAATDRKPRRDWLRIGLTLLILGGCVLFLDIGKILTVFNQANSGLLAVVLLLMLLDRVVMAFRSALLLNIVGARLPFRMVCRFYFQGAVSAVVMPSAVGGELLRAYWISKASGVKHPVYAALLMEKMLGFLSATNWAIVGILVFSVIKFGNFPQWLAIAVAALTVVNGAFAWSMTNSMHRRILSGLGQLSHRWVFGLLEKSYASYTVFSHARTRLALNFLLTLIEHFAQLVLLLLIANSLKIDVDPILFLAASAVHVLIFRIPITPDGWGVMEVSAIGIYGVIGVGPEAAFAMMFLAHVMWTLAATPGILFLLQDSQRATQGEDGNAGADRPASTRLRGRIARAPGGGPAPGR